MKTKFYFKLNELKEKAPSTIETEAFCPKDWLEGAEFGYEVGINENNGMLLTEAYEIIKIVAQRWSSYQTGEKAKVWLNQYNIKIKNL